MNISCNNSLFFHSSLTTAAYFQLQPAWTACSFTAVSQQLLISSYTASMYSLFLHSSLTTVVYFLEQLLCTACSVSAVSKQLYIFWNCLYAQLVLSQPVSLLLFQIWYILVFLVHLLVISKTHTSVFKLISYLRKSNRCRNDTRSKKGCLKHKKTLFKGIVSKDFINIKGVSLSF